MRSNLFLICIGAAVMMASVFTAEAQIKGARDYLKRLEPAPAAPPQAPARPLPAARPVPARPVPAPPAAPAAPVDPEKARAAKEESLRKTIEFQKKRAEEGSASAQYDLGVRYLNGDGVEKDTALGRQLLAKAAKNGNSSADKLLKELEPEEK